MWSRTLVAAVMFAGLAGCTTGGSEVPPPEGGTDPSASAGASAEAPVGFVAVLPSIQRVGLFGAEAKNPQEPSALVGPTYGVQSYKLTTAGQVTLTAEERSALQVPQGVPPLSTPPDGPATLRAPAGQEFVAMSLDRGSAFDASSSGGLGGVQSVLRVAGKGVQLGAVATPAAVLAAVPKGAEVRLETGDPGHLQALDLRTGKRVTGIPAMYVKKWPEGEGSYTEDFGSAWMRISGKLYAVVAQEWTADLNPWLAETGYAPAGKLWLRVHVNLIATNSAHGYFAVDIDPAKALRVGAGSATIRPVKVSPDAVDPANGIMPGLQQYTAYFAVAEKFRKGVIGVSTSGAKVWIGGKGRSGSLVENRGLKALPITLR